MIHLDSFCRMHELFYINSSLFFYKTSQRDPKLYWVLQRLSGQQWRNTKPPPETLFFFTQLCFFFFFFFKQCLTVENAERLQMRSLLESIFGWAFVRENPLVGICFGVKFLRRLTKFAHIKHMFVSILLYQMEFTLPITVIKIICPGLDLCVTLIWRVRETARWQMLRALKDGTWAATSKIHQKYQKDDSYQKITLF